MSEHTETQFEGGAVIREPAFASSAVAWPLDPKELEERLWRIDLIARTEYDTDEEAFAAVKQACFRLRLDIAKAAARAD